MIIKSIAERRLEGKAVGYDIYFMDGDESCCTTLTMLRSDQGDGGWSLHTELQMSEAEESGEAPAVLLSGPSEDGPDGWCRPNRADLHAALMASGTS